MSYLTTHARMNEIMKSYIKINVKKAHDAYWKNDVVKMNEAEGKINFFWE